MLPSPAHRLLIRQLLARRTNSPPAAIPDMALAASPEAVMVDLVDRFLTRKARSTAPDREILLSLEVESDIAAGRPAPAETFASLERYTAHRLSRTHGSGQALSLAYLPSAIAYASAFLHALQAPGPETSSPTGRPSPQTRQAAADLLGLLTCFSASPSAGGSRPLRCTRWATFAREALLLELVAIFHATQATVVRYTIDASPLVDVFALLLPPWIQQHDHFDACSLLPDRTTTYTQLLATASLQPDLAAGRLFAGLCAMPDSQPMAHYGASRYREVHDAALTIMARWAETR